MVLVCFALCAVAAADETEGIYGWCYRYVDESVQDADTSTVYCKKIGGSTVTDVTGDDWPTLDYHCARFADYTPPGTLIYSGYWYKLMARKTYGTVFWESEWSDSMYYNNNRHNRDLYLENTGAGGK